MKEHQSSVVAFECEMVSFAEHFATSEQFEQIFKDGMSLVERTSRYLEGPGRREARELSPSVNVLYATESMRLTTRLLETASWLLVRRSLAAGEITAEEARVRRRRIRLNQVARPGHVRGFTDLPRTLKALIEESYALNDRIVRLDRGLEAATRTVETPPNPVGAQIATLSRALRAGR